MGVGTAVRLRHIQPAGAVVCPKDLSCSGVQCMQKDTVARPDTGSVVDRVVHHYGSATRGPARDHALVAQTHSLVRPSAMFPKELPVVGLDCIEMAVVTNCEDPVAPRHRGKTHGTAGEKRPPRLSAVSVNGNDLVLSRTTEYHSVPDNDRLIGEVERNSGRVRPSRRRRRSIPVNPTQLQVVLKRLG